MTDRPANENRGPPLRLKALPDGSLSEAHVEALRSGDAFDLVGPIVVDTATSRITHLNLVVDDTYHFVGWNPNDEHWERILTAVEESDDSIEVAAVFVLDDQTGDYEVGFDPSEDPDIEELVEFVWGYVEYTYPDTDRLFNVMDEAMAELSADEE